MYASICEPESAAAMCAGIISAGFISFRSAGFSVFGGQQKYHTSIIEFDTINCSSRDKKPRPIPSARSSLLPLLLLSLTFKAASALIYKLILLNSVAQRVSERSLGYLLEWLSCPQPPHSLQQLSKQLTNLHCLPTAACPFDFGTLTHLIVSSGDSIVMPKRVINEFAQ